MEMRKTKEIEELSNIMGHRNKLDTADDLPQMMVREKCL
jgi:hypothetical protein